MSNIVGWTVPLISLMCCTFSIFALLSTDVEAWYVWPLGFVWGGCYNEFEKGFIKHFLRKEHNNA